MAADRSQKNAAEGATFSAAVLPLVHHCSPEAAAAISVNLKFGLYDAGVYPSWAAVRSAFEETYACLGFTCSQVGALVGQTQACDEHSPIAGYFPGSDVTQHNAIDLDQAAMETELASFDFDAASAVYMNGGNSLSKGSFRTLQGFSTGAQGKMYDDCP